MKEINLPSGNYIFVEVPNDANNIIYHIHFNLVSYFIKEKPFEIRIPNGKWLKISTTNDITEEQAVLIAEKGIKVIKGKPNFDPEWETPSYQKLFMGYVVDNNEKLTKLPVHQTAKKSLQSLIQSVGLDLKNNYLILKKL